MTWTLAGCRSSSLIPPGYIAVGLEAGPITLDPRFATDATASQIGDLLFDGLTRSDDQSHRLPQLAVSWEVRDRLTYVFHLRDGMRFADSQPLTAFDVKATYDSVLDVRTHSPKQLALASIVAVEAPDALTVLFRLRHPFAPFLEATGLGILPARQIATAPTRPLERPTGSGAFRILEFVADEKVVVARNPNYRFSRPPLDGIVFEVVPDAVTRLLELKRGTLDLVQNAIDPDALGWLRQQPDLDVVTHSGTTVQYLGFNLRDPRLTDVRVRHAIAHAIDRDAIIGSLLKGLATPATGLLAPTHWAFNADVPPYTYNPALANAELDAAGYPASAGGGPRFRLSYKTTFVELRRRIAEVLQAQLAQVGIALDIQSYEWATFYHDIQRGQFQLYSLAWVGIDDPDIYYLTCHSSQQPPQGMNRGYVDDAALDALTEAARRTDDLGQRRTLYAAVQEEVARLLPVIPLWWTSNVAVLNRRLRGFEVQPNASYVSLKDAWIDDRAAVRR